MSDIGDLRKDCKTHTRTLAWPGRAKMGSKSLSNTYFISTTLTLQIFTVSGPRPICASPFPLPWLRPLPRLVLLAFCPAASDQILDAALTGPEKANESEYQS